MGEVAGALILVLFLSTGSLDGRIPSLGLSSFSMMLYESLK
jgi:hypothetical protein